MCSSQKIGKRKPQYLLRLKLGKAWRNALTVYLNEFTLFFEVKYTKKNGDFLFFQNNAF
jgi:hypothetical protein